MDATVTALVRNPAGNESAAPVTDEAGVGAYNTTPGIVTMPRIWVVRVKATTPYAGTEEIAFEVRASAFTSP